MIGTGYVAPSKGQVLKVIVSSDTTGGVAIDITQYVHCIRVYEDICKAYITAQIIIYDNDNVIENLGITAGSPVGLAFWAPPNDRIYDSDAFGQNLTVLKLKGEQMPGTLSWQMYYLDCIGSVYYQDRATSIQDLSDSSGQPGTALINRIWNNYLNTGGPLSTFNTSTESQGTQDDSQDIPSNRPFEAIRFIMKKLNDTTETGNWLLFRDAQIARLGQLQTLFDQAPGNSQQSFIQKETWSAAQSKIWGAGFNDADIYRAIIVAQMNTNEDEWAGGRASGQDVAAAQNQRMGAYDIAKGRLAGGTQGFTSAYGSGGGAGAASAGAIGSIIGGASRLLNRNVNTSKQGQGVLTSKAPAGGFSTAANALNSPALVLKVPLQTGINCTIGKGIDAQLLPPTGGKITNSLTYLLSGTWLVIKCCHEIYTDQRESQATTVMQTLKGTID